MTVAASAAPADRTQAIIGIARIVMGLSFIYYGISKFFFIPGTIAFIGTKLPFPSLIFWLAVVIELGGGTLLALGIKTRWIAAWYVFYCCFTAAVFHFVPENRGLLDHFAENFALAGGFLILMAVGPGAFAVEKDS
ncbi:MAG TPA: DoxX family protein [Stellaceae bacterium]|jgi:putative oxidoreductase|nr:DoxX family protein [Stellaceae bacterium]